jgi:hypothetical protein
MRERNGAGERNRTPDRLITNQLLYLLSYASLNVMRHCKKLHKHNPFKARIVCKQYTSRKTLREFSLSFLTPKKKPPQ